MLEFIGVNRIITVDLHSLQAQGFVSSQVVWDDFEGAFAGLSYFLDSKVIENKEISSQLNIYFSCFSSKQFQLFSILLLF